MSGLIRRPLAAAMIKPWVVLAVFFGIFLFTASRDEAPSIDPEANALTAYLLANRATPYATEYTDIVELDRSPGQLTWFVKTENGPASQYPPGAALLAVPLYLVADDELNVHADLSPLFNGEEQLLLLPDMWPSAVAASLSAAAAMAALFSVLLHLGVSDRDSLVGVALFGLGTAVWTVASDSLWQHGPAIMAISGIMLAGLRRNHVAVVAMAAYLVLVRPPAALLAVAIILGMTIEHRDRRLLSAVLVGSGLGALVLSTYNWFVFQSFSIVGGYGDALQSNVQNPDLGFLVRNALGGAFSPDRGVAVWSPVFFAAIVTVPFVRTEVPYFMRWAIVGAFGYMTLQYLANNYVGGAGFSYYRYPLEAMAAVFPAAVLGGRRIARSPLPANRFAFVLMAQWSVMVHLIAAARLR